MQDLVQMTFLYPYVWILFILYIVCEKYCKQNLPVIYFSNMKMLQNATSKQNNYIKILRYLIVFLIVLALSSPVVKNDYELDNTSGYEISLILDASGSMHEDDRFIITKEIVADFIDKRKTDRLALSVFADFTYVAVPLTYDKKSLKDMLQYMKIGVAGTRDTALYESLYLSSNLFKKSTSKNKIAILLTDGLNTVDTISLDLAIDKVKKHGIKVYTIGIGNKDAYNQDILEKIAKQTNGKFYETTQPEKLKEIYAQINTLEKSKIKTTKYTHNKHYFQYLLALVILLLLLYIVLMKNRGKYLVVLSLLFAVAAMYRPTILSNPLNLAQNNTKLMVAFDISASMQCSDIYPSRLEFAQKKFYDIVERFTSEKIGILGFSNQSYLIAPTTSDYDTLKYLVRNINLDTIDKKGSNLLEALISASKILKGQNKKSLIVLTDGTNNSDFSKEIQYAKEHNISVYIYNIGTKKGSIINSDNGLVKDDNGNIVVTKLNQQIKELAIQTKGIYKEYSINNDDINIFVGDIKKRFNKESKETSKITNNLELYYIPLTLSFILFFLSVIRIRGNRL